MKQVRILKLTAIIIPVIIFISFIPECLYRQSVYGGSFPGEFFPWVRESIIASICEYSPLRSLFTSMLLIVWVLTLIKLNKRIFTYTLTGVLSFLWLILTAFSIAGNQIINTILTINRFELNYLFGCCIFIVLYLLIQQHKHNTKKKVNVK